MIIDAHQHFWKYDVERHAWIDDNMKSIRLDFLPEDLEEVYNNHNIDGCVAVQADQTLDETDFLLKLARENSFIKGVVGWADLRAKDIDDILSHYGEQHKLKGFRHIVQGEADPNFLLRSDFLNGISNLEKYNFTYDILVFPHQLGAVLELVRKFPDHSFVIDHIAKPYIKEGFYDGWAVLMTEIAKQDNVYCKLSGMVTEADFRSWTPHQIEPYMELVLKAFGTDRLLFGSDWPVCLVAGNFGEVKGLVTDFISTLTLSEQAAIMGENAVRFYDL